MPGKYFEDLNPGDRFTSPRRTVTEADVVFFTSFTGLLNPLFIDEEFAREKGFGGRVAPGPLTVSLALGLTDELASGTTTAALGIDKVRFLAPVRPGDTIGVMTTVLEKRESASRPDRGPVVLRHEVRNQRDEVVCTLERTLMFLKRS
ncbi:MAG: MaoC family dehydratase [Chloroflexota bacterium]|nr:MaoC family dehydratase [Chloroflexota bacterium]